MKEAKAQLDETKRTMETALSEARASAEFASIVLAWRAHRAAGGGDQARIIEARGGFAAAPRATTSRSLGSAPTSPRRRLRVLSLEARLR